MGTVPQNYHDFCYYIGEWLYVATAEVSLDAPAAQKNVTVEDGSVFAAGMPVWIKDSAHSEWNEVASVLGDVVTMVNNLQYTYYIAKDAEIDHPDATFGKAAFAAAFALEYLYEAYSAGQFSSTKADILARIVELADFILTQQCTNAALKAYGGFKSLETSTQYWSVDAGRCIPALLKAYSLTVSAVNPVPLAGWLFQKAVPIEPGVDVPVEGGFQMVSLHLYFGSGVNSKGVAYLSGKCKADFSDIRCGDVQGNLFLIRRRNVVVGVSCDLDVRVLADLNVPQNVYLYFGNQLAEAVDDDGVFETVIPGVAGAWPLDEEDREVSPLIIMNSATTSLASWNNGVGVRQMSVADDASIVYGAETKSRRV
ncbi:MAG: hypothetical protein PHI16_06165, partial [Methanocellales archaeon]|nr:hypothetical protein [Methanocellales archaeon]